MKLRITPKRLDVEKLLEDDRYITNTFWMVDKRYTPDQFATLRAWNKKRGQNNTVPMEHLTENCERVLRACMDGSVELLTWNEFTTQPGLEDSEGIIAAIPYTYMHNSRGERTKLNAYYVQFFGKLGGTKFSQNQTYKNQGVIVQNEKRDIIGVIMPVRI